MECWLDLRAPEAWKAGPGGSVQPDLGLEGAASQQQRRDASQACPLSCLPSCPPCPLPRPAPRHRPLTMSLLAPHPVAGPQKGFSGCFASRGAMSFPDEPSGPGDGPGGRGGTAVCPARSQGAAAWSQRRVWQTQSWQGSVPRHGGTGLQEHPPLQGQVDAALQPGCCSCRPQLPQPGCQCASRPLLAPTVCHGDDRVRTA